jgi:acyl-CoA synthetase (AMP-forming)/AMP-acid ligase II
MSMLYAIERTLKLVQGFVLYSPTSNETIALQLEKHAARRPQHPFLLYGDRRYTYGEANAIINQHAHAYRALGVGKGDVVALALENRPEFIWHMFALHKLGAVSSLINTHGQGEVLAHALRVCEPKRIIIGSEIWSAFSSIRGQLGDLARGTVDVDMDPDHAAQVDVPVWSTRLTDASSDNPPESGTHKLSDHAAYIYTSGTTGLPKAAVIRHHRFYRGGRVWAGAAFRYTPDDVLYNCLPLYHSNSVLLATSSAVTAGVTMALARKFSRTRFWDDIRKHGATAFIYIGELCRYLVNNEPSPRDREHKVRVVSGNGLRPDIWETFQERFGIGRVAEFYGATEGNCITINLFGTVGSVGRLLPGMTVARWDEAEQSFVRDAQGFLIKAKAGEPGILLGKIRPRGEFDGYQDKAASEKKVVRDAFAKGDAWFNTGDLLRADRMGNLFFVDRLGDTFRWKGENVATSEVQEQLARFKAAHEVNVYGVQIPNTEGRAGMAAIVLQPGQQFDADAFYKHAASVLPAYSRPLFVRIMPELATTGTFKMKKTDLQKDGFDPAVVQDPIYFLDSANGAYVPLDASLKDAICSGKVKL